ncbi:MAG TPA: sarcosine oxidase subunit beta family protein [Actinomycetota bacterium]
MATRYWRAAEPRRAYDVVVVGGGGHGLATAYYLARNHHVTDVCVVEKGWLGGGNTARNTTIIRSNYLWDESAAIYEHALRLWEGLEEDLGLDLRFSQRGVLNLAHDLGEVRSSVRRVNANALNGVDAEWLTPEEVAAFCPIVNLSPELRYPVLGATLQRRGGIARHDRVAWGFATAADRLGVDIVEHCEVTGFVRAPGPGGGVAGVETTRGTITANKVAVVAAGHTSVLAAMVGLRLPLQSHPLQALVSVLLEPVLDCVVMSNAVHVYVSQADKGELVMGAGIDGHNGYSQRGAFHLIEEQLAAALELFPVFTHAKLLRTWGGIVDVCPDASPIIGLTPIEGLYLNCGWGTGGFKATPGSGWVFAETIAKGEPAPLALPFALDRFTTGALIDEHGAAAVAH